MKGDGSGALLLGAALMAILVIAGVAVLQMTATTTTSDSGPLPGTGVSSPVVFDLRTTSGLSILGLDLRSPTYEAHIAMTVPPMCVRQESSGVEVLLSDGVCADLPVRGALSGGGTTATGERLVFVRIEVSEPCYAALTLGDAWPPASGECAAEARRE